MSQTGEATITVPDLERNVPSALQGAATGPLIITDHGRPAFVLMTIETYRAMAGGPPALPEPLSEDGRAATFDHRAGP